VNATLERVRARVTERFPADLERIRDYLRLPSVSATGEGIRAAAEATGAWIEGAGGAFELVETPGHPVVLGELRGPPGAPRLLRYGMYDVQPAEEPGWTSPPFAAEIRDLDGVGPAVVARGSANSKGCLWCAPYYAFDRILGLPWAAGGVGHAAGAHGPDESATLAGLQEHVVGAAAFLLAYANGTAEAPA
jgi:acetylornithine deacetylase/succinyl-diaminopimelate desuccinylase-like protein